MAGKFQTYRQWQEEKRKEESAGQEAGRNTRFQTYAQWRQERQTPEEREKYYQASGMDSFRRDFSKYAAYDIVKDEANREWAQNIKNQRDYFTRYASHFTAEQLAAVNQELDLYESIVKDRSAYARVQPEIIRAQGQQEQYAQWQQKQQAQQEIAYDDTGIRADTQLYKNPKALAALEANGDEKAAELRRKRYQALEKEYGNADSGRTQRESREKRMRELDAQLDVVQQNIQNVSRTVTGPLHDTEEGIKTANQLRAWNMQRDRLLAEKQALSKQEDVKTGVYAAQEKADSAMKRYKKAAMEYQSSKTTVKNIANGLVEMHKGSSMYDTLAEAQKQDEDEAEKNGTTPTYDRLFTLLEQEGMTPEYIDRISGQWASMPYSQAISEAKEREKALSTQEKTLRTSAQRESDAWEYEVAKAYSDKDFAALSKPSEDAMPDGTLGEAYNVLMQSKDSILKQGADFYDTEVEIGGKTLTWQELTEMSNEERKLFFYYCNTGNEDMAALWLASNADALKYRRGETIADLADYPGLREIAALGSSAVRGAELVGYGVGSIFADIDAPDVTSDEYALASLSQRNKGTVAGFMVGAAQNIGNMAPSLAGYAIHPAVGLSATFLNARGNAYVEAKREGFTHGQAWIYSTLVGASEAGLEKVLGGMGGIAKGALPEKLLAKIPETNSIFWKLVKDFGINASSELIEENLQNYLDPAFAMIAGMTDQYDAPGMEDFIETSVVTAITTLFFSASQAQAKVRQEKINQAAGRWADAAIRLGEDNPAYQEGVKLRETLDSGENVSQDQMLAAFDRVGKENATKIAQEADVDKIVEKAKAQLKDVKAGWFTWDTAIGDAESVTEAWEQSLMEAYESEDAQEVLKTAASAVKLAESAQINLDNAYKLTRISLDEHEAASREVQYVKDTASEVIENYRNGIWSTITPMEQQTQEEAGQEQKTQFEQAYIDAGAPEDVAQTAGEVLDGIVSGEITSQNITNRQIMELMADKGYGREAIAQMLGVEVTEEKTTSAMRRAVKRAIAQYENNMALQDAAGEQQEATAQPDTTEGGNENAAEGTQSVRRDRGRNDGVGPGEQAGSVGESGSQRTAQRRAEGNGQQNNEKALRRQRQKERIKRYESLTDTTDAQKVFNSTKYEGDIAVVPEELYTQKMRDAAREVEDELGVKVVYFKGTLIREDASRRMRRTAGFFDTTRNEIWATVGSELFEPEQLVHHEKYHALVTEKQADVMQTVDKIMEQFDVKELEALVQRYVRAYAGVYDNESVEDIYEELLADAYAGMNRFGDTPNATQYQQAVKENVRRGTRENERAMRDTRGAPENRYSLEDDVAELDEAYRQEMDSEPMPHRTAEDMKREIKETLLRGQETKQTPTATVTLKMPESDEYGTETTVTHEYGIGKPFYSRNTTLTPKEAIGYLEAATGMKWQAVPMKKGLWKAEMTTEELDTVFAPRGYSKYVTEMKMRGEKPLSQKEYAQEMLAKAWRDPNEPSAATVHPEGVRKEDFSASPALERIGVKIDGSVVDYETTQQIRQAEYARFNIRKTIKSTIRRYGATNKEVAHAKSIAEGIDSYFDVPESCRFHVVSELAGLYMDERMAGNNLVSQRKIAIKTALLDKAIEMFPKDKQIQENPDLFNPTKLLTMNYRTPERNMRKIFGDELGGQIYDYYFAPVQANEAERTRWMQKQFDEVRRFRGEDGKLKKLNKAESAYTHELLDLQSYVEKVYASEEKREIMKAAEKLRRLQREGKVDKNTRWDLAVEFDLDRAQSEWMMKYAQWLTMKEGKPESVDETKCMEAAKKYRELFDDYFDAINDFLVSHGGQPIGKIEGYAPHISLNEKVNLLNQTLEKLGFNDNATKLPAEIAGLTEEFRPDKRWTPFFQKRNGSKTDYDIMEGFERYVTYISDVLYHMDDIQKLRAAESYLRMGMGGSFETSIEEAIEESRRPDINDRIDYLIDKGRLEVREREDYTEKEVTEAFDEFIDLLIEEQQTNTRYSDLAQWMQNYTNILAGKQFGGDRGIEHMGGRGLLTLGNRINAVFARANVAGNLSSALNQTAQLPAILSERRASSVAQALGEFTTGKLREFSKQSDYITSKKGVKYVARSAGDMFIEGVFKPVEFVDSMMSTLAVRSAYLDGIKNGMTEADAMRFADNFGRKIMADRSKGSKPNAFHSKGFVKQMLHMFQIEALNSWEHISQDLPSDFRAIARDRGKASAARALAGVMVKYLIAAFVLNRWAEETYGGTPAPFDLIGMTSNFIASGNGLSTNEWIRRTINKVTGVDVFEESAAEENEEFDWGSAIEDTTYNLSNEIPFVSNLSGMLSVGDRTLPTAIPGFVDAVKGIYNALTDGNALDADTALALVDLLKTAVPGGRQIGKMVSGIRSAFEGGKMNGTGDNERLQYVTNNTLLGVLQQVLFGPNATAAAKEHYASGESGLSATQTMLWKDITEQGGDGKALFALIQSCRKIENDEDLTTEERGELRRNEIAASGFTDEQKAYIYSVLFGGADGTSQDEPFEKLMDAGMSWDDITEMFNEFKRIYYIEDIKPTEQTTKFQYWLDQQRYTQEQRDIINEEFQYYQYVSSDPEKTMYSKLRAQGVSPDEALRISENTKAQDGESVKPADKIDSIMKQGMSEEKTYEALGAVLNEGVYGNLTEARAAGISCKTYIDFWQRKQKLTADKDPDDPEKTISGSKKKKVIELIDSLPLSSTQKDVLILQEYPKTDVMEMPWN